MIYGDNGELYDDEGVRRISVMDKDYEDHQSGKINLKDPKYNYFNIQRAKENANKIGSNKIANPINKEVAEVDEFKDFYSQEYKIKNISQNKNQKLNSIKAKRKQFLLLMKLGYKILNERVDNNTSFAIISKKFSTRDIKLSVGKCRMMLLQTFFYVEREQISNLLKNNLEKDVIAFVSERLSTKINFSELVKFGILNKEKEFYIFNTACNYKKSVKD